MTVLLHIILTLSVVYAALMAHVHGEPVLGWVVALLLALAELPRVWAEAVAQAHEELGND